MGWLDRVSRVLLPWPDTATDAPAIAALSARKALADVAVPAERDWTYSWAWQDSPGGISLVGGYSASYAEMYRRQPWVYIAVRKLYTGIGRLPLKVYERDGEERKRDRTSSLAKLLTRPYPGGSPFALKSAIVGDLGVYGNSLIIKQGAGPRGDRPPAALYPVCPINWAIDRDGDYVYRDRDTGVEKGYRREQIIHHRYWRPGHSDFGLAPLEPLRMTLAIEDAAQRLGVAAFKNGGNRPGLLSTDQHLTPEDQQRLTMDYNARHTGVDNAYKTPVLFGGLEWHPTGGTMAESAVVEHRKLTREEVAAVYDIPPVLLGILDRATFSNVEELHLAFYQDTLGPWTTLIEETLQEQLIAPVAEWGERYAEFDMNEVLKGAVAQRFDAYNKAVGGPWMAPNEARARENLPKANQEEADLIRFPLNMSSAPPADPAATESTASAPKGKEVALNGH